MLRANCVPAADKSDSGEPVVRLLNKAVQMDQALKLLAAGDLNAGDMAILWAICSSMDRQTGECTLRYKTIADKCHVSRTTAVRAVSRLKKTGLLIARERFYKKTGGKIATAFMLGTTSEKANEVLPLKGELDAPIKGQGRRTSELRVGAPVNHLSVSQGIHNPTSGIGKTEKPKRLGTRGPLKQTLGEKFDQLRIELGLTKEQLDLAIQDAADQGLWGDKVLDHVRKNVAGPSGALANTRPPRRAISLVTVPDFDAPFRATATAHQYPASISERSRRDRRHVRCGSVRDLRGRQDALPLISDVRDGSG